MNSEYGSEGKPPQYVGILKTPGRRKNSSNRVEFLDNLQEKEIPGRYAWISDFCVFKCKLNI